MRKLAPFFVSALLGLSAACGSSSTATPDDAGADGGGDVVASDASDASDVITPVDGSDAGPGDGGKPLWAKDFPDNAVQDGTGVAVDTAGNIVIVGYFQGTVDFGGGPLVAAGGSSDIYVAKFDPTGKHLWSKRFGDTGPQVAFGVAVDGAGSVYITGYFTGTLDFGVAPALVGAGKEDAFVAKLDTNGVGVWSKGWGDGEDQSGYAIAVDAAGVATVTGYMRGTTNFGTGVLTSAGGADLFVVRLDAAGATTWAKRFGDASDQFGTYVTNAGAGAVLVTGELLGVLDFGGGALALTSAGKRDAYLVKLDATGAGVWAKRYGDVNEQFGDCIAVDATGNIAFSGGFQGTIDLGNGPLSGGPGAKFVAKLDGTGKALFSRSLGTADVFDWTAVAFDKQGNVVVGGEFQASIDFGAGAVAAADGYDIFVAKYGGPQGALVWGRTFGDARTQVLRGLASDPNDNTIITGFFDGIVDFGFGQRNAGDQPNVYVAKLAP